MLKQLRNKKNIAIIRGLDVRIQQAELASFFKQLNPVFIGNLDEEIITFLKSKKVKYINLNLKPVYLKDPVGILSKGKTHQSWLHFNDEELNKSLEDIDIVEIYEPYFFYSSQVARYAKIKNIPLITEIWTSFANHPAKFIPPYSFNVKTVIKNTNFFILRTKKALSYLKEYDLKQKEEVIYPGVNLKRFYPVKKKIEKKTTILFVGSLEKNKGLDDLLFVFSKLFEKYNSKIELIICGKGSLEKKILSLTKELPVKYLGFVSNLDLPKIYQKADIFCGPSKEFSTFGIKRWEEFVGYVFLEALSSGIPIVSTDCGGIKEIIGNKNLILKQGNREELYKAINSLILNPKRAKEIGIANRKRAENLFDLEKQVLLTEKKIIDSFID